MPAHLTILASGSSGNAAFLHTGRTGLLIDCGLGPRLISYRLAAVGLQWANVSAVVLTHTHGDHWNRLTLLHLARLRIPLLAHPRHLDYLAAVAEEYPTLRKHDLVRTYDGSGPFEPIPGVTGTPVRVPHDSEPTFAFRFDGRCPDTDSHWSVGYASDLGTGTPELVRAFAGVDVLALEFNHDEAMERASGRPRHLIARVLGRNGHLSNRQAADVSRDIISPAAPGPARLQSLVQLHLSRHCNRAELAVEAGQNVLARVAPKARLWTATQDVPCGPIPVRGRPADTAPPVAPPFAPTISHQPRLPGLD
jgi:phosphoribosyl 1,2-cyclic phosphodiesterase